MSSASNANINHVSDTALMVAACRAMETERPDGLVRDPFAKDLAGEKGMAIAMALPHFEFMCFGIGIRSRFMDALVSELVTSGKVETVIVLGCGLDTRPWRMELPNTLRWIEVDFPDMLEYKRRFLDGHAAKCRVEDIAADLNDASEREKALALAGNGQALMITEGLLMYLPSQSVEAIAAEAHEFSGIRYWLTDITSEQFSRMARQNDWHAIENVRAKDHLHGGEIIEVAARHGWRALERRSYATDSFAAAPERIKNMVEKARAEGRAAPPPTPADDPSGVHLFGRE